ncbi:riboflavin synthase alpha chain [Pseudobutyrivibrio sp. 49]|uniref:riboflavin synthase n=1 Tax=unclassified Pseudobutyrivibrio TaxID=2638619 RepID=UPI00088EA424|nr:MULTISPECIES: riboflavin synthase [unclassified Pseudobutyrivibrio]SDI82258.1 riboflavin synthase alpha chain [Pseudobutyrivibrio sp. 49]SFN60065.1 riboflavin synthase alpha chain [Pseudobutyrivibrio sp. UC1225]
MFTGIVEELGKVQRIERGGRQQRITINCSRILEDIHMGDSIAVNGVCLTVVEYSANSFSADVMNETFSRSSLGSLTVGSPVDLERAMAANGRFGGHIVSGHIDGTGIIKNIRQDGNAVWFEIKTDVKILDGIVEKGSITIDGISLTVAGVSRDSFKVSIIPHTLKETVLGHKKIGDIVNLENDVVGKYIKKFLGREEKCEESRLKELLMI